MSSEKPGLETIIASRICHDLAGALGALSNGFELMQLMGKISFDNDEFRLIEDSLTCLTSRLQMFRLAFGRSVTGQDMALRDLDGLLRSELGTRIGLGFPTEGTTPHLHAKTLLLGVMCVISNLPHGGQIHVSRTGPGWQIRAEAADLELRPQWAGLCNGAGPADIESTTCEFAILTNLLAETGARATLSQSGNSLSLDLILPGSARPNCGPPRRRRPDT